MSSTSQRTQFSHARPARSRLPDPQVRVPEQRIGRTRRQPRHMPRNLQTHETILVPHRGSQHRARVFHQAHHRPDGCDADMRGRIGQQPRAVSAVTVDTRPELRQRVERRAAHARNVVVEHRSEPLRGAGVPEGAECPDRGEPAGVSAIPECFHRDLDGPAISNPPQRAGDVRNQREVDIEEPGAQRSGCPLSLQVDEPSNRGADNLGTWIVQRPNQFVG